MNFSVIFPSASLEKRFAKELRSISDKNIRQRIAEATISLADNPFPFRESKGSYFKKLKPPIEFYEHAAQYRIRISDYRVLYDVDIINKKVIILALRKRSENTYR